jgi:hypothetical protein
VCFTSRRNGVWSISFPAFSLASRYFSETIGMPSLTACDHYEACMREKEKRESFWTLVEIEIQQQKYAGSIDW